MPYESNPYNSTEGREMVRKIFHNLFLNDGTDMKIDSAKENVSYFRGHNGERLHQTVQIMKNFIRGFRHKAYQTSLNSGILICPHCYRRDFMWLWEFVDFGLRNDNYEWTSSVEPDRNSWEVGFGRRTPKGRRNGWRFMSRVRCNKVTTCDDCKITTTGTYSTCRKCSGANVVHAGCHHESYMVHVVQEEQKESWLADASTWTSRNVQNEKYVALLSDKAGGQSTTHNVKPFMYRVRNPGPAPEGLVVTTSDLAFQYIPQLEVGYQDRLSGLRRPYGYKCPECDFMRYTPLHDEDFAFPSTPPPAASLDDRSFSSKGNKEISTGMRPTINQNGQEQQGGLVDNMGYCPNPDCDNIKLVPSVSIKTKLGKPAFNPSTGNPWHARAGRASRGSEKAWTGGGFNGAAMVQDYCNKQIQRATNAVPPQFPFSPLHSAFSRSEKEVCTKCEDSYYGESHDYFWDPTTGATLHCTSCEEWQPQYRRLLRNDLGGYVFNPPQMMRIVSPQPLNAAYDLQKYQRVSGNTADETASQIWGIRLDCPMNPDDAVLQSQAQLFSLMKIPNLPTTPPQVGMGITMCPNDVEGTAYGAWKKKELLKKSKTIDYQDDEWLQTKLLNLDGLAPDGTDMKDYFIGLQNDGEIPQHLSVGSTLQVISPNRDNEFQTITSYDLLKYRPGDAKTELYGRRWTAQVRTENVALPLGADSYLGITSPGYTFIVCEGRSRAAYLDKPTKRWVDFSPQCASYHNRLAPEVPLDNIFYYPRWTQTPDTDIRPPTQGNITGGILDINGSYYWNSTNHFTQDQFKVDNFLAGFMGTGANGSPCLEKKFHDFKTLEEPMFHDDSMVLIFECKTCMQTWELGADLEEEGKYTTGAAVKKYYQNKGWVDADGITTDDQRFPQECMDAAIAKERDQISNWGIEDGTLQGLGRGGSRSAKEMLDTPRLLVEED